MEWLTGSIPTRPQPTGKGCIRRERDVFGGHRVRQTEALVTAGRHAGLLNAAVDLRLRPIGRPHQSIETRHRHKETDESNTTRTAFDKHHMSGPDQPVEEGQPGNTGKKLYHTGARLEAVLPRTPCLQRGTGHV